MEEFFNRSEATAMCYLHHRKARRTLACGGKSLTEKNVADLIDLWRQKRIPALYLDAMTMAKAVRGEISWDSLKYEK
jgi:hypothetical protein